MAAAALYVQADGHLVASELTRGPWDRDAQHGGAPAALIMRALEQLPAPDDLLLARVTYELLRPVPIGPIAVAGEVVRPGRRVQLLEASLTTPDGVEVMRARALRVRRAETAGEDTGLGTAPPGPDAGRPNDGFRPRFRPMFAPDAIEIRFIEGGFGGGASTAWFRLHPEVVAGERPTPLQRLAAAADFGNGISSPLSWDDHVFINPDLTVYLEREPEGEWIGLESCTRVPPGGIGMSESALYDERGRIGRAIQSLFVAPR
jgi:hypothetical protein